MMSPTWSLAFFANMGGWGTLVVLLLILVLFGSRLPQAMKSLGASIKEFKKGVKEGAGSPEDDPPPRVGRDKGRDGASSADERESERRN